MSQEHPPFENTHRESPQEPRFGTAGSSSHEGSEQEFLTEDLALLTWAKKQRLGASPAFKQKILSRVEGWSYADAWPTETPGAFAKPLANPFVSKSRSYLRRALAVYMGVAAALLVYMAAQGSFFAHESPKPEQASVKTETPPK